MKENSNLIENRPLYSSVEIERKEKFDWYEFTTGPFEFYCKKDKKLTSFQLEMAESIVGHFNELHKEPKDFAGKVYTSRRFTGICQYCKQYEIDILLNIHEKNGKLLLRKIGQYPPFEIQPTKELKGFLTKENLDFYSKALMNMSTGYGIGSFAYLRRIIESEIHNIVKNLLELDTSNSQHINDEYQKYLQDHQMSKLIDSIYAFLPTSLKQLGNNPLKLMYEQLSIGIHKLTDEECLEKAVAIDNLLKYIVKNVNIEKNERSKINDAMNKLTS